MDGSEDLLIHCLKSNQLCAAGLDQPKVLYYIVLEEGPDPSETSEGLTHTCITKKKKQSHLTTIWEKLNTGKCLNLK